MTLSKALYEVCKSLLLWIFLKLQALCTLKNRECWEEPLMLVPLPPFHTFSNSNWPAEAFLTPWLSRNSPCWRCVYSNGAVEAAVVPKPVCLPPYNADVLEIPQT